MPLCLAIATASEAPPLSGIIAGIVGGIVVGIISGSPLGVSGPAAGLAAIVAATIKDLGGLEAFDVFLCAVVVGGVLQIILGFLKAGVIGYYFPNAVIKGMLAGIGIIIFLKQIPHVFGYEKAPWGEFSFFNSDGENTFSEMLVAMKDVHGGSLLITAISLGILILWDRPFMKRIGFLKFFQGPLVAVVVGILLYFVFGEHDIFGLRQDQVVEVAVSPGFTGLFSNFVFPDFSHIFDAKVLMAGATIGVVASIETLLCVEATDKLDPEKRVTPTNRELLAQGSGNLVSGLIGGLPITQVIVRSSANIQSGGKSKLSAIIHGFLLLFCVMAIPHVLSMIPQAVLAAILMVVGYKLARPTLFKSMYRAGWQQFMPFIVTIIFIVFTDLLTGVALGLAVAIVVIMWNNYRLPYRFNEADMLSGKPIVIELAEEVSFLNKAGIQRTLNEMPDNVEVIIDATNTHSMHPDVVEIINDFLTHAELVGIKATYKPPKELSPGRKNPVKAFVERRKNLSND